MFENLNNEKDYLHILGVYRSLHVHKLFSSTKWNFSNS